MLGVTHEKVKVVQDTMGQTFSTQDYIVMPVSFLTFLFVPHVTPKSGTTSNP